MDRFFPTPAEHTAESVERGMVGAAGAADTSAMRGLVYSLFCGIPGHRALGMNARLTVT
jgi:azurin